MPIEPNAHAASQNARIAILNRLRATTPFEDAPPRPAPYLHVTSAPDGDLVDRFRVEVERLNGKVHLVPDAASAIRAVLTLLAGLGPVSDVIAWDSLPVTGLDDALQQKQIRVTVPRARQDTRTEVLRAAAMASAGITGADAGFATTGTLALITKGDQGRLPSLLPPVHIAMLEHSRLFARLEDWLTESGRAALHQSNSLAFVTGPSRTSDIEMQTILGVHGPGALHIILIG